MILLQLLIALIIATIIYRWQKQIDRETIILSELRKLCADYIAASRRAYFEQPFVGDLLDPDRVEHFLSISELEQEMYVVRNQIYLLAPVIILDLVEEHDRAFRDWKIHFPRVGQADPDIISSARLYDENLRLAYDKMLNGMRLWLQSHSDQSVIIPTYLLNLKQKHKQRAE